MFKASFIVLSIMLSVFAVPLFPDGAPVQDARADAAWLREIEGARADTAWLREAEVEDARADTAWLREVEAARADAAWL